MRYTYESPFQKSWIRPEGVNIEFVQQILCNPYKYKVFFVYIGKQWRPRSDDARRGVWSEYLLFASRIIL